MSQPKPVATTHTPMTPQRAAAIQSATAKTNGGKVPPGSFASRAQGAAHRNSGGTKR